MGLSQLSLKMAELLCGEIHSEEGPLSLQVTPQPLKCVEEWPFGVVRVSSLEIYRDIGFRVII